MDKGKLQASPTLKEEQHPNALMTAINSVVEKRGDFKGVFRL
ncbi:MAG: hypothetical protein AB7V48_05515 [Sedimentibacter sp.]